MNCLKICYLVSNDITHDPRVAKQIASAQKAGFECLALGFGYVLHENQAPTIEKNGRVTIMRGQYSDKLHLFVSFLKVAIAKIKKLLLAAKAIFLLVISLSKSPTRIKFVLPRLNYNLLALARMFLIKRFPRFYAWLLLKLPEKFLNRWRNPAVVHPQRQNPPVNLIVNKTALVSVREPIIIKAPVSYSPKEDFPTIFELIKKLLVIINKSWPNFRFYWAMTKFLAAEGKKFRPDIIHANDLDTLLAGWFIKQKTGAKLVYDAHEIWTKQGLLLPKTVLLTFSWLERFLIKKIDAFVSVNESIIQETSKMYNYHFKIPTLVIFNCPNYELIQFAAHRRKKVFILFQGRYCFDRGLEQLAESARYLEDNAEIHFRALGDPPTKKRLEEIVKKFGLQKKVKFFDPVPMDQMVKSAKSADIGVISYIPVNINNRLCTPNKLFEYMMAGLALAVSNLPELSRVVKNHQNGVTFNPRSPKSIAESLNRLVKERKTVEKMRQNSLNAAKKYSWEEEEKKLLNLYRRLSKHENS